LKKQQRLNGIELFLFKSEKKQNEQYNQIKQTT